jgi:hypothetical protein
MRKELPLVRARCSIFKMVKYPLLGAAFICCLDVLPKIAEAQHFGITDRTETREWAPPAIQHAQQMRKHKDSDHGSQSTPTIISRFSTDEDPSGQIATFQPGAATFTANNAFFQDLGTNGRTCFTCHQPQKWMDNQRVGRSLSVRRQQGHRSAVLAGRRRDVSDRRRLYNRSEAKSL